MVAGALMRVSVLRFGLGVGRALIASGLRTRPSHSCDGWVCDLGALGASSIFGLVRMAGAFTGRLLTFASVSGIQLAQHNCSNKCYFVSAAFPSRLEALVGDTLARVSALRFGLGVGGTTIASGSRARTSHSWTSRLLNSPFSLGVSSLFCRATQCMRGV